MTTDDSAKGGSVISDEELAGARRLCDASTPGPWEAEPDSDSVGVSDAIFKERGYGLLAAADHPGTAAFIAASRSLVPRLLDLVARQRAALRGKTFSGESPVVVEAERDELRVEVERLRARAADVDDAKRIWADETLRKVPRLSDGTEYEVGTLVIHADRERYERVGLAHAYDDRVHRISSLLGGYGIECGPQQFGRQYLKRAPEGAEVTCPYCAGWPEQMAKMRVDAEVYRRTREIEDERDIVRSAIHSLALLAREGFSRGWDGLDALDKNAAIDALVGKATP